MSSWLYIFCYCIVAYGASNIIVFGSGPFRIFEVIRRVARNISSHFGDLFNCMMCLPANFGWICSLVNFLWIPIAFTPFNILLGGLDKVWYNVVLICLCDGAFTSGIVWFIHNVELFFENKAEESGKSQYTEEDPYAEEVEDIRNVRTQR